MHAINRKKLSDAVIKEIRCMIASGELSEGDKLPNQSEFSAQLGVSRTVLREALQALSDIGVVQQRPKSGTIILSTVPLTCSKLFHSQLHEHPRETLDLLEARRYLEAGTAELAAENATSEHIQKLEGLLDEMKRLAEAGDFETYGQKNVVFHFLIAEASQNSFMTLLLSTVRRYMEAWILINEVPLLMDRSLASHRKILLAIKRRDPEAAKKAMQEHIHEFRQRLENYFSSQTDSELKQAYPSVNSTWGFKAGR
jgi:GntR family transcriptional repressor for pyruvate dehydrogenase complex